MLMIKFIRFNYLFFFILLLFFSTIKSDEPKNGSTDFVPTTTTADPNDQTDSEITTPISTSDATTPPDFDTTPISSSKSTETSDGSIISGPTLIRPEMDLTTAQPTNTMTKTVTTDATVPEQLTTEPPQSDVLTQQPTKPNATDIVDTTLPEDSLTNPSVSGSPSGTPGSLSDHPGLTQPTSTSKTNQSSEHKHSEHRFKSTHHPSSKVDSTLFDDQLTSTSSDSPDTFSNFSLDSILPTAPTNQMPDTNEMSQSNAIDVLPSLSPVARLTQIVNSQHVTHIPLRTIEVPRLRNLSDFQHPPSKRIDSRFICTNFNEHSVLIRPIQLSIFGNASIKVSFHHPASLLFTFNVTQWNDSIAVTDNQSSLVGRQLELVIELLQCNVTVERVIFSISIDLMIDRSRSISFEHFSLNNSYELLVSCFRVKPSQWYDVKVQGQSPVRFPIDYDTLITSSVISASCAETVWLCWLERWRSMSLFVQLSVYAVLLFLLMLVICFCLCVRRWRRHRHYQQKNEWRQQMSPIFTSGSFDFSNGYTARSLNEIYGSQLNRQTNTKNLKKANGQEMLHLYEDTMNKSIVYEDDGYDTLNRNRASSSNHQMRQPIYASIDLKRVDAVDASGESSFKTNLKSPDQLSTSAVNLNREGSFGSFTFEQRFLANTMHLQPIDQSESGSKINRFTPEESLSFRAPSLAEKAVEALSIGGLGRVLLEHSVAGIRRRNLLRASSGCDTLDTAQRRYVKPIALDHFRRAVSQLRDSHGLRYSSEFMKMHLQHNSLVPSSQRIQRAARNSRNAVKNKYNNILPYDHARVILQVDPGSTSDYINASYIPGENSAKEYIATQSPMKCTIGHFWQMIWQEQVQIIVMTTAMSESGVLLEQYWPPLSGQTDQSELYLAGYRVRLIGQQMADGFICRQFLISKDDECRVVKQFQLVGWKELRLPEDAQLLLNFIYFYRDQVQLAKLDHDEWEDAPIVVHCSAGVGRTGVFIAIDRVFSQLSKQKNDFIDLYGIIIEMRRNRPFMVQTEAQYVFVHECVAIMVQHLYPQLNTVSDANNNNSLTLAKLSASEDSFASSKNDPESPLNNHVHTSPFVQQQTSHL